MSDLGMSVDELVAYISKTCLPTLLVEGTADRALLRRVESELSKLGVDVMPVGGRDRLWEVYGRRVELQSARIVFLRDRDEWVAIGVPKGYEDFVLTTGYSIENDVVHKEAISTIAGSSFHAVEAQVGLIAQWFKHALQIHVGGGKIDLSRDISRVVDGGEYVEAAQQEIEGNPLSSPFCELADEECWEWLRGKTLLRVLQSELAKGSPSYDKDQIMDLCLKLGPSMAFRKLIESISDKFVELVPCH